MSNYCIDELRKIRCFNRKVDAYKEVVYEYEQPAYSVEFMVDDISGKDKDIVKDFFFNSLGVPEIASKNSITRKEVRKKINTFKEKIKEYAKV